MNHAILSCVFCGCLLIIAKENRENEENQNSGDQKFEGKYEEGWLR